MSLLTRALAGLLIAAASAPAASLSTNLPTATRPAFYTAAQSAGLNPAPGTAGDIVIWESSMAATLTDPQIAELGERIRAGASLFLLLDAVPGTTAMRLAFLLPTTAWGTQVRPSPSSTALESTTWDRTLFPHDEPRGLAVPYHFDIRPVAAIERGQQRYERLAHTIQYTGAKAPAGDTFWTRPLLNRDWQVRIRGNSVDRMPLLVTGQYGAGRVAIFGSGSIALERNPELWATMLRWLSESHKAATAPTPNVTFTAVADGASIKLDIANGGPTEAPVKVLLRFLTWEHAYIGETEKNLAVKPHGNTTLTVPLPENSTTAYQALDFRRALEVRTGILSSDGATLLSEKTIPIDLDPPLQVTIRTPNIHTANYPFHAPGPSLPLFRNRMGARVTAYAEPPGTKLTAEIELSNGLTNLAAFAKITDETTPDNPSLPALTDGAMYAEKTPIDTIQAYGAWAGAENKDNSLRFQFAEPVTVTSVVLVGSVENERSFLAHNPGAASVEINSSEAAQDRSLDEAFQAGNGRVRIPLKAALTSELRIHLPWIAAGPGNRKRQAPWLGEVEIEGYRGPVAATQGTLNVALRNSLTGESRTLLNQEIALAPGARTVVPVSLELPSAPALAFYRLEATLNRASSTAPLMSIDPSHPLLPIEDLHPLDATNSGFIVTRGFRLALDTGTGTSEIGAGWAQPDDLVWAYSRQFKQLSANSKTEANRLYVTENDMRHYSTPWRGFPDGERFFEVAAPSIVELAKKNANWNKSDTVILGFSDRWDTGPQMSAMHGWEDFISFDEHIRALGLGGIEARDRAAVAAEIHQRFENEWQAWQLSRYVRSIRDIRDAFAQAGKKLVISAQGLPLVAAAEAVDLAKTIAGMSDDETWGMTENSVPATTGRQLAEMAYNPVWRMSTLIQWGFNSSVLNNPQWHAPAGTTEPTRRHYYDRAWRGVVTPDGTYRSMYTYGYNSNAGLSFTMTENDWQQWWQLEERHSLIAPEAPIGAGIVMSTSKLADPRHIRFAGGGEGPETNETARTVMLTFRRLHEAGISIPFATNITALTSWTGSAPLIVVNPEIFSEPEIATLRKLHERGVLLAGLKGAGSLPPSAAALFQQPGTVLLSGSDADWTVAYGQTAAAKIQELFHLPVTFPEGTAGYGFLSQGLKFIVVEDWLEQGRVARVRLRATPGQTTAHACDANDHAPLTVHRDGPDWVIETPLRPGDGVLIALAEGAQK